MNRLIWPPKIPFFGEPIMSSVIIIQGDSLDSFYDQTMDYLEAKYHYYPPCTPDLQMDSRTASEMGFHERMAADIEGYQSQGIPLGKMVV